MISLTMHTKAFQNNLENEINNISKEDGIAEEEKEKHFKHEFTQVKNVVKKLHMMTPKIEKM